MSMKTMTIAPLPEAFLRRVRNEGIDDLGQAVKLIRSVAGGEPCRDVLRRARPGEELILASYSPFAKEGPYHEYGPVFVLAHASEEDVPRDALPIAAGYLRDQFVLRAYSHAEEIHDAALLGPNDASETLARFLENPEVAFVHARFPVYGCFACRIDRV